MDFTEKQEGIIEKYIESYEKNKQKPSVADLRSIGVTRDKIRHHFSTMKKLHEAVNEYDTEGRISRFNEYIFEEGFQNRVAEKIKKYKRFLITTAIAGCDVDRNFLKSLETYCKKNKALLLVLPVFDLNKRNNLDPVLEDYDVLSSSIKLNSNMYINNLKISPRLVDPLTGLDRVGQREYSYIYPSPKQRLKFISNQKDKLPTAMMTTGALTTPAYVNQTFRNQKSSYVSKQDHVMGCVVVEVSNNKYFHFRQIQCDDKGGFYDLGRYYIDDKITKVKAKAFIMGDYHSGQSDAVAEKCWLDVIKKIGVEYLVFHDIFNGLSISHHDQTKKITLARRAEAGQLCLKDEILQLQADIQKYVRIVDKIIISKSNHDEFLERYLQECRFKDDPLNLRLGLELALRMVEGHDPLQWAMEEHLYKSLEPKYVNKIKWLKRDESFKIGDIEVGEHGDKGAHGSYGSLRQLEKSYGKSISGHSHVPEILRGAYRVGTTSWLDLEYNNGMSSWMHTSCLLYDNGNRQLINVIDGKWSL